MSDHAICSPSGASGWIVCPGWEGGSGSSKYSRYGTAGHTLAERCLTNEQEASFFIGEIIAVEGDKIVVDKKMVEAVQKYIDFVTDIGGELYIEQKLSIEHITGEKDAKGTSDAVVLFPEEICVVDLKMGTGVIVDADENEQLQMYALAALEEFSIVYPFKTARLIIMQPRLNHVSEWSLSIKDLLAFGEIAKASAQKKLSGSAERNPTEDGCRWCSNKASCEALRDYVSEATADMFDIVNDEISPDTLELVEQWVKAKRAELEARLFKGETLQHWKLVEGRKGHRSWSDKDEAEKLLKSFRLKKEEMYEFSLISPTNAEKLLKEEPRRWAKVEELITRKDGQPSVVSVSDKRPALQIDSVESGFEIITIEGE